MSLEKPRWLSYSLCNIKALFTKVNVQSMLRQYGDFVLYSAPYDDLVPFFVYVDCLRAAGAQVFQYIAAQSLFLEERQHHSK